MTVSNTVSVKVVPNARITSMGKGRDKGSLVLIYLGNIKVAGGILGGTYNEQQALTEFKKGNPKLKIADKMEDVAKALKNML